MNEFDTVLALVTLLASPEATKAKLVELREAIAAADTHKAEAEAAHVELAARVAELDERKAELDRRETEIVDQRIRLQVRAAAFDEQVKSLTTRADGLRRLDEVLRRRVMQHHNQMAFFNEKLQDLPTWEQIDGEIAAVQGKNDPIYDRFAEPMGETRGGAMAAGPKATRVDSRRPRA